MDGVMVMGAGDIRQELLGHSGGDSFVIGANGAVERNGRDTAGQKES